MAYKEADYEESARGRAEVASGTRFFSPKSGDKGKWATTRIRILPPRADHPTAKFYHWTAVHNIPGSMRAIQCNNKMNNEPCPACVASAFLRKQGNEDDAIAMASKWRGFVNVVEIDEDGEPVGDEPEFLVWSMPKTLLEDLLDKIDELPVEQRNITSPKKGRDVIVRRKGERDRTRYEIALADSPRRLIGPILELIEQDDDEPGGLNDLTTYIPRLSGAQVTALLDGGEPKKSTDPWGDDEDEDKPAPKTVKAEYRELPAPKAPKKPVDDDEDDEDEDEDEDEAPKAKKPAPDKPKSAAEARRLLQERLRGRKKPVDDDEDEDEDED